MALGLISSAVVTLSAGTASVTVPASCSAAVVFGSYGTVTASSGWTGVTLNSLSPDVTIDLTLGELVASAWPVGGWVWWNPASGSRTLAMSADNAFTSESVMIAYVQDSDTAAVRASGIDHELSTTSSVTLSSIVSGDLILSYSGMYSESASQFPDLQSTFTSEQTVDVGQAGGRLSSKTSTTTSQAVTNSGTASPESFDNLSVAAFALAPAAVGSSPIPGVQTILKHIGGMG